MSIVKLVLVGLCSGILLPGAIRMAFDYFHFQYAWGAGSVAYGLGLFLFVEYLSVSMGRPGLWIGSKHSVLYKWSVTLLYLAFVGFVAFLGETSRDRYPETGSGLWNTLVIVSVGVLVVAVVLILSRLDRRSSDRNSTGD